MDKAIRDKLAQHKKARRSKTILLKDLAPSDLLIGCDYWEDAGRPGANVPVDQSARFSYLRWASTEQVAALQSRLPHRVAFVPCTGMDPRAVLRLRGHGRRIYCRPVVCFPRPAISCVLGFLLETARGGADPSKYLSVYPYGSWDS
jgi:hypothetical protein